jgi:hypothetical protein
MHPQSPFRPQLEALEDRCLPNNFFRGGGHDLLAVGGLVPGADDLLAAASAAAAQGNPVNPLHVQ